MQHVDMPIQHKNDVVLGTQTVLSMKYKDGVLIACDTNGSVGGMKYTNNLQRITQIGKHTLIAGSGEYSDYNEVRDILLDKTNGHECTDSRSSGPKPSELFRFIQRKMYKMRNKGKPYNTTLLLCGMKYDEENEEESEKFVGEILPLGTNFTENYCVSGAGFYITMSLIRKEWREDMTRAEAEELIAKCMRVLYMNVVGAGDQYYIGHVDKDAAEIVGPINVRKESDDYRFFE